LKLAPRIEANRSACSMSSDRKLRRRRIVSRSVGGSARLRHLGPARRPVSIIPSCASAGQHLGHEQAGWPAAPASPAKQSLARCRAHRVPRPGPATAAAPRPPRLRYRPRRPRQRGGPAGPAPPERGDGRKHAMRATGRYSARRPRRGQRQQARRGRAHCRSSTPITSGPASRELLHQVGRSASTTRKPQARVAGHRDRIAFPGAAGQQVPDGRPPGDPSRTWCSRTLRS